MLRNSSMGSLKLYLVGYFVLLIGAGLALWQAGVLDDIPGIWLAIGIIVARRVRDHARGGVHAARRDHDHYTGCIGPRPR